MSTNGSDFDSTLSGLAIAPTQARPKERWYQSSINLDLTGKDAHSLHVPHSGIRRSPKGICLARKNRCTIEGATNASDAKLLKFLYAIFGSYKQYFRGGLRPT